MVGWAKGVVSWKAGGTLYLSVPFTWLIPEAQRMAAAHKGKVVAGGPAVQLMGAPWAETPAATPYDVLAMHNPLATFTTRGCPNKCSFCAVPKLEGDFRELDEWRPNPVLCDNNLLAASRKHFSKVIDSVVPFGWVDFNQAIDARLFTRWHADEIRRVKHPIVRFSYDHSYLAPEIERAVQTCKDAKLPKPMIFALIGFHDTPGDAHNRLKHIVDLKCEPFPMRYQPLDALEKDAYVKDGWTARELSKTRRYYSRLRYFRAVPFDEFEHWREDQPLFDA
jgi:hypothetical protein